MFACIYIKDLLLWRLMSNYKRNYLNDESLIQLGKKRRRRSADKMQLKKVKSQYLANNNNAEGIILKYLVSFSINHILRTLENSYYLKQIPVFFMHSQNLNKYKQVSSFLTAGNNN